MNIQYYEDERTINLELVSHSDGDIFEQIAKRLSRKFRVKWLKKIDGFDQRYWDFEYKKNTLTLHLEHYLGVMIYADKSNSDIHKAVECLKEFEEYFLNWIPKTN